VRSITRYARTVREPGLVLQELDEAVSRAFGEGGEPGPVYLDFPTDTLRADVPKALQLEEHFREKTTPVLLPDPSQVQQAVDLLWSAKRPLIISGRGARGAGKELTAFLDLLGAVYLDTSESKGLVHDSHPSVVAAMRGAVMGQADVVVTIGRRLDFQLAYGSPAVFGDAKFVRIADTPLEIRDNRRGVVELFASPRAVLAAINATAGDRKSNVDREWAKALRDQHLARAAKLRDTMKAATTGSDGRIQPLRLLAEIQEQLDDDAVIIADGGDFLSFARVGLSASSYLDPGSLGEEYRRHARLTYRESYRSEASWTPATSARWGNDRHASDRHRFERRPRGQHHVVCATANGCSGPCPQRGRRGDRCPGHEDQPGSRIHRNSRSFTAG